MKKIRLTNIEYLKLYQWIEIVDSRNTFYCFITDINLLHEKFDCYAAKAISKEGEEFVPNEPQFTRLNLYSSYKVYKMQETTINEIEDKTHLIDLALQTKDEEWFKELIG